MASAFALREPRRSSAHLIKKADFTKQTARTGDEPATATGTFNLSTITNIAFDVNFPGIGGGISTQLNNVFTGEGEQIIITGSVGSRTVSFNDPIGSTITFSGPNGSNVVWLNFIDINQSVDINPDAPGLDGFVSGLSYTAIEVASVPIPAAVYLFCSGLLGLIGIARRKKTT